MCRSLIFITPVCLLLSACLKDSEVEPLKPLPQKYAAVTFDFSPTMNGKPLVTNSGWYSNAEGDSLSVNLFNYYISNVKLVRNDGTFFAEPNSYHLNKHAEGRHAFTINNVPEGTYSRIDFSIGVDSIRNSSGAQTGALDVSQGMFWEWNTGYIFFKLEGNYKTASMTEKSGYTYHVGTNTNRMDLSFPLPTVLEVKEGTAPAVHYKVSVDEVFQKPETIRMDEYFAFTGGPQAAVLAKNYSDMFSVEKVKN